MSDEIDIDGESGTPIWAAFGDLMSVLLGAFVLILVGVIGVQLQLSSRLDEEVKQRQVEAQRRKTLEQALAAPLAAVDCTAGVWGGQSTTECVNDSTSEAGGGVETSGDDSTVGGNIADADAAVPAEGYSNAGAWTRTSRPRTPAACGSSRYGRPCAARWTVS